VAIRGIVTESVFFPPYVNGVANTSPGAAHFSSAGHGHWLPRHGRRFAPRRSPTPSMPGDSGPRPCHAPQLRSPIGHCPVPPHRASLAAFRPDVVPLAVVRVGGGRSHRRRLDLPGGGLPPTGHPALHRATGSFFGEASSCVGIRRIHDRAARTLAPHSTPRTLSRMALPRDGCCGRPVRRPRASSPGLRRRGGYAGTGRERAHCSGYVGRSPWRARRPAARTACCRAFACSASVMAPASPTVRRCAADRLVPRPPHGSQLATCTPGFDVFVRTGPDGRSARPTGGDASGRTCVAPDAG